MSVLRLVPSDAVVVSHVNLSAIDDSAKWWSNYRGFLSPLFILPNSLPNNLNITSFTIASFPTTSKDYSAISLFSQEMIITTDIAHGEALREYIAQGKDSYTFVHYTTDSKDTAYIVVSDIPSYNQVAELVAGDSSIKTFDTVQKAKDFTVDSKSPSMFIDMSKYFSVLTAKAQGKDNFNTALREKGLGLNDNTVWFGSSVDKGITWKGKFISGGIDVKKIDVLSFKSTLNNEINLVPSGKSDSGTGGVGFEYGSATFGLSAVGEALSVSKGDQTVGAVINPHNMVAPAIKAVAGNSDVEIVISPQMLQSAYQGMVDPSTIHTVTMRIKGDAVDLIFDSYKDSDFAAKPQTDPSPLPSPVNLPSPK